MGEFELAIGDITNASLYNNRGIVLQELNIPPDHIYIEAKKSFNNFAFCDSEVRIDFELL